MSTKVISTNEMGEQFGVVLSEIKQSGGPIMIERDGQAVAVVLSVSQYRLLQGRTELRENEDDLVDFAFGMWADYTDMIDGWSPDNRGDWRSTWHE